MKPYAIKKRAAGLLLLTVVTIMAAGCASSGSSAQVQASYYGYGYYGPYDPYYRGDVIVGVPPPPTDVRPPGNRPSEPPQVSQLPARPLPAPAPRPMPSSRPAGGRRR